MAKKKKEQKETTIENFYDLKTEEMDELVAALKSGNEAQTDENAPTVSLDIEEVTGEQVKGKKQFDPYKVDRLSRIPAPIKAFVVKWWFAGLVCYLIDMGLGTQMATLDLLVLSGFVLGLVVDLMVNPILRMIQSDRNELNAYIMFPFPFKAYWTLITNTIYYIGVMIVVNYMYYGVNILLQIGNEEAYFALEPLLFGVFCVIADMAFIGIKDLVVYLVKRGKKKRALANGEAEFDVDVQPAVAHKEKRRRKGKNAETAETLATEPAVSPETNTTQDGDLTDTAQQAEGEELDEIERLRRLAQSEDEDKSKSGKKK